MSRSYCHHQQQMSHCHGLTNQNVQTLWLMMACHGWTTGVQMQLMLHRRAAWTMRELHCASCAHVTLYLMSDLNSQSHLLHLNIQQLSFTQQNETDIN